MTLNRREFLQLLSVAAGAVTLTACRTPYDRLAELDQPTIADLQLGSSAEFQQLNRLTYGPTLSERTRVAEISIHSWIEEQLAWKEIDDSSADLRLRPIDSLDRNADELYSLEPEQVAADLRSATLLRQIYSRRQIYEQMVEFWSDHFNISMDKGDCWWLKPVDDRSVIRPHALGNFRDLLWASAHSPAMLVYLDNQANEKSHPNENYARELMELHTLGVNGGYSQDDVMELARCLTGWRVKDHFWLGDFTFDETMHDDGRKQLLGRRIEPNGQREAEDIIEQLADHPSTARHIVQKLAQRFLGANPPRQIVQRAEEAFRQSNGDIRTTLRPILLDGVAAAPLPLRPKYKRPLNFVTSALRQLRGHTDGGAWLHEALGQMGQLPFAWPTPDGFPDENESWANNLMPRWRFALDLATDALPGSKIAPDELLATPPSGAKVETAGAQLDQLATLLLGQPLPPALHQELLQAVARQEIEPSESTKLFTALLLASPAFQWR